MATKIMSPLTSYLSENEQYNLLSVNRQGGVAVLLKLVREAKLDLSAEISAGVPTENYQRAVGFYQCLKQLEECITGD